MGTIAMFLSPHLTEVFVRQTACVIKGMGEHVYPRTQGDLEASDVRRMREYEFPRSMRFPRRRHCDLGRHGHHAASLGSHP